MLELVVIITLFGILVSSGSNLGNGNPFFIYFAVWFGLFFGLYLTRTSFDLISPEFIALITIPKLIALAILVCATMMVSFKSHQEVLPNTIDYNINLVSFFQAITVISLPFAYSKATSMSGGDSIFSIFGYVQLRGSIIESGGSLGIFSYISILSIIIASIRTFSFKSNRIAWFVSVLSALFYAYISTGRTSILLLSVMVLMPLVITERIKLKSVIVFILIILSGFVFISIMTAKGISSQSTTQENVESFLENLRSYTIAPLLAFSSKESNNFSPDLGVNTFRLPITILNSLNIIELSPKPLIRDYEYTPYPTNVYTVYETYFMDFKYFGLVIPPLFLIMHYWLFVRAKHTGGVWIFYYSSSTYPLIMQFFQDQYFSLLSMWLQIALWYMILIPQSIETKLENTLEKS